jgi:hypothetical protein
MPGLHLKGGFVRERIRDPTPLRRAGYRFRTVLHGSHRAIVAWSRSGKSVLQALLHPRSETHGSGVKFVCHGDACRRIKERHG